MGRAGAHTALPHKMTEGLKQPYEAGNQYYLQSADVLAKNMNRASSN